jgi:hypothetical protein
VTFVSDGPLSLRIFDHEALLRPFQTVVSSLSDHKNAVEAEPTTALSTGDRLSIVSFRTRLVLQPTTTGRAELGRGYAMLDSEGRFLPLNSVVVAGRVGLELPAALIGAEVNLLSFKGGAARGPFGINHHAADRIFDLPHYNSS